MEIIGLATACFGKVVLDHCPQPDQHVPMLDADVRCPDPLFNEPEHGMSILFRHDPATAGFAHDRTPGAFLARK
jgi:hypothetical protein